ncbi:MAG: hypothetical protein PHQ60_02200 [Sideroxydans sp.]|nr:hypothetical protein [Sideroxydans sp.]MDD5056655.1 hypothetical protein [Sideroxydans sp.]
MGTNPIIKSLLITFAFWYLVLFILAGGIANGYGLPKLPYALYNSATWCLIGVVTGVCFYWVFARHRRENVAWSMKSTRLRGLVCSLGELPLTFEQVKRAHLTDSNLTDELNGWFKEYREQFPLHANLMMALMEIYEAFKTLPASPVAGGHGGLSLQKHTENVLRTMFTKSKHWSYIGHRGKAGKILFPLIEPTYKFNSEDPLVALCAYAHDLGKVECYKLLSSGMVKEVKPNHDLVSGAMLIKLPEFWALPKEDRDALKMCVSYYHHLSRLPLWPDDRTRALAELLIRSDIDTGKAEGLQQNEIDRMYEGMPETSEDTLPVISAALLPSEDGDVPTADQATHSEATGETVIDRPAQDGAKMSEEIEWAYSAFLDVLCEEGRINGGDKKLRIGIKHADWVYINDAGLRKAVSESFGMPEIAENQRGQQSPFTFSLLEKLAALKVLKQEHDGKHYSTKRALFHIQDFRTGGKGVGLDWQYTIIFRTELFPHLKDKMKDSPREPVVIGNGWGDHAALNKAGTFPAPEPEPDAAVAPDAMDPFPPSPPSPQHTLDLALREISSFAGDTNSPIPFKEREYENVPFALFSAEDLQAAFAEIDWQAEFEAVTIGQTKILPDCMKFVQGTSGLVYLGVRMVDPISKPNGEM